LHGTMSIMTTLSDDEIAGRAVRAGRKRLGLSVQQFADRAEVSLGLVSTRERGQVSLSLDTLRRLAAVLGVPVGELLELALEGVTVVRAVQRHQLPIPEGPKSSALLASCSPPGGDTRLQVIGSTLRSGCPTWRTGSGTWSRRPSPSRPAGCCSCTATAAKSSARATRPPTAARPRTGGPTSPTSPPS